MQLGPEGKAFHYIRAPGARKTQPLVETQFHVAAPAVVLDTNAALDWLVFADARIAPLAAAISFGRLRWLAEPRMRTELAEVLARPPLARHAGRIEQALATFDRWARTCPHPPGACGGLVCKDSDDQIFLDLALAERASWLVTRDKALLALHRRALASGLSIVVPEAWPAG